MDQAMTLRVRERAYHIWAARGGDADKNWLQAETEMLQLTSPQSEPAFRRDGTGWRDMSADRFVLLQLTHWRPWDRQHVS